MLYDHRGLHAARILLHASNVSDGYVALWERHRLDLTVEALILEEEGHPLFSDQERDLAQKRLTEYGYTLGAAPGSMPPQPPAPVGVTGRRRAEGLSKGDARAR